jgi:DNA-directed RNA polymerase specialized sigma24 family protein
VKSERGGLAFTTSSFERLLAAFDSNREQAGERYELLHRKLVMFFECRQTPSPEDGADETLCRVAARLERGEVIHNIFAYAHGVARLVALERTRSSFVPLTGAEADRTTPEPVLEDDERARCLRLCLAELTAEHRRLVLSYYQGERGGRVRHRADLAGGTSTLNALRIRVHRIRAKLERCVRERLLRAAAESSARLSAHTRRGQ